LTKYYHVDYRFIVKNADSHAEAIEKTDALIKQSTDDVWYTINEVTEYQSKRDLLSDEYKVAVTIYELAELEGKTAYFSSIKKKLRDILSPDRICECLNTLQHWRMIKMSYSSYLDDCGIGYCVYLISSGYYETIKMLHEEYWRETTEAYKIIDAVKG